MKEPIPNQPSPKRRIPCPGCEKPGALPLPPTPGDKCAGCGYDPGEGLSEEGWVLATELYDDRRKTQVAVRHPDVEDKGKRVTMRPFTWEDAREITIADRAGSAAFSDGKDLASVESIRKGFSKHKLRLHDAVKDIAGRYRDCDIEMECTVWLPALNEGEATEYEAAGEIREALDKIGTDRRQLLISKDKGENAIGKRITTSLKAGKPAEAAKIHQDEVLKLEGYGQKKLPELDGKGLGMKDEKPLKQDAE